MSAQRCKGCGERGHNIRSCPRERKRRRPLPELGPHEPIRKDAPILVAVRQHAERDGCAFCRRALDEHADDPGKIRVFIDLCAEAQKAIKNTPAEETRAAKAVRLAKAAVAFFRDNPDELTWGASDDVLVGEDAFETDSEFLFNVEEDDADHPEWKPTEALYARTFAEGIAELRKGRKP